MSTPRPVPRFSPPMAAVVLLSAVTPLSAPLSAPVSAQTFEPIARAPHVRVPLELMSPPGEGPALTADASAVRTTGRFPVLVIPALFEDSPEPAVSADRMAGILFGTVGRTLTTFYEEMSHGALTVEGAIPDWVRTPVPILGAAGEVDGHGWIGERAGEHFAAAIAAVDSVIDFTLFDNDGPDGVPDSGDDDGYVDAVTFKFTEVSGSCGGPGFWPHRGTLRDGTGSRGVATEDEGHDGTAVRVADYTTESAVECDGVMEQGPNVMAHEFGHILGLPDFYRAVEGVEATERHWMVGCFGLMAAGSWGCGRDARTFGFGPSGISPLSRLLLGWGEAVTVGPVRDAEYVLDPVQTSGQLLKVPLTPSGAEYLLVEYRPRLGFDDVLPDDGVLIYHVDEGADIMGGAYAETFPYWIVERDGSGAMRRTLPDGGDRGVAEDYFGRGAATDSLTPATRPSTRLASGEASTVWIHAITVTDGAARIRLTTTTALTGVPLAVPTVATALEHMEVRYRIDGGIGPYSVVPPADGMPVQGLVLRMDGDEVVVDGAPLAADGAVVLPIHVVDVSGDAWWAGPTVVFRDAVLTDAELLTPLLSPGAGETGLRTYLDGTGNGNGSYDVGDLRAYIQRTGGQAPGGRP